MGLNLYTSGLVGKVGAPISVLWTPKTKCIDGHKAYIKYSPQRRKINQVEI